MPRHPPYTLSSLTISLLLIHMVCTRPIQLSKNNRSLPDSSGILRTFAEPRPAARPLPHRYSAVTEPLAHWWSWAELNRRPSACKADALPTELQPHTHDTVCETGPISCSSAGQTAPEMVGLGRVELPTSRLSGVRSSQLSYRPRRMQDGHRATQWSEISRPCSIEHYGVRDATVPSAACLCLDECRCTKEASLRPSVV